jgi:hypothetical protein
MTEEKEAKKEAKNEEIDPKLKELIEIMKLIQKEMPNAEKEERITVFLEYTRERKNYVGTEKQSMSNENHVDIESLLNSLSFRQAKNGKSEFASIDPELGKKLPKTFERGEYNYYNKGDALIRVKNTPKQKNVQKQ